MPNWCYNNIEILGEPKVIKRLSAMLDVASNKKKENFFETLIGVDEKETTESLENGGWYNHNIDRYGTKWDLSYEDIVVDGDSIVLNTESAWSPPIEGMRIISAMYDISVSMYYEEPGADFCGKAHISSGSVHEEDYTYQEGVYVFEGYAEWYDREFANSGLEWMSQELEGEDKPDFVGLIKENYPFLKEEEVEECASDLEQEVAAMTGKEF